jgi:hypothetical protein
MSENTVIQESIQEAPATNPYDTTQESYEQHDAQQSLETAMDEKIEAESANNSEEGSQVEEVQEPKNDFDAKFAALSRREKQLREKESQMQQQYEAKLAEIEAKLESLSAPKVEEVQEVEKEPELPLEYRLKKDPLGTLSELGLSYDQLTNLALNDGKLTPEMQMELMKQELESKYNSKFESLQNELLERDKRLEEEKYNETVTNFKNELTSFVNSNDNYELIRANDAVDVVYDVIEEHYKETGNIMSKQEAADQVESYLEAEVEKLLKLNKLKSRFAPPQTEQPQQREKAPQSPTLSNTHSTTVSKPSRPKSRDASVASAASLLRWND